MNVFKIKMNQTIFHRSMIDDRRIRTFFLFSINHRRCSFFLFKSKIRGQWSTWFVSFFSSSLFDFDHRNDCAWNKKRKKKERKKEKKTLDKVFGIFYSFICSLVYAHTSSMSRTWFPWYLRADSRKTKVFPRRRIKPIDILSSLTLPWLLFKAKQTK